jgi:hypothetical protein
MLISMQRAQATRFLKKLKEVEKRYKTRKDRQFHACLTLVATVLIVGTDVPSLIKRTGYRKRFVSTVSDRMRLACLWNGDQSEIDEWADSEFMMTIFAHAGVASGRGGREINSDGTISYFDLI